jgi:hypothetical protein
MSYKETEYTWTVQRNYMISTGGPILGTKVRLGRDADHSPLSSAEVENE